MRRDFTTASIAIIVFTVLLGLVYPLAVTGISEVAFPGRAGGSTITRSGHVIGSRLIAQAFVKPVLGANGKPKVDADGNPVTTPDRRYFQPRPSQTQYNPAATAFSNLGPNGVDTRDTIRAHIAAYLQLERPYGPLTGMQVPVDAATDTGSGVDPQISIANARIQSRRVAAVRSISRDDLNRLIDRYTNRRFLGLLGEPGVNVLELNLALDQKTSRQ
ncbi:MAG: potassium-transporting ATPase subunit C [Thermoleophilia bacterium]|nr:potassium-transporting ATPase subunit C [Thermoleophilia bacterium]